MLIVSFQVTLIVLIVILSKLNWRVLSALFQSVLRGSAFSLYQWNGNTTYYALQNLCQNVVDAVTWSENLQQKVNLVIPVQCNKNLEHLEVRSLVRHNMQGEGTTIIFLKFPSGLTKSLPETELRFTNFSLKGPCFRGDHSKTLLEWSE